jgi:hypothetical protein
VGQSLLKQIRGVGNVLDDIDHGNHVEARLCRQTLKSRREDGHTPPSRSCSGGQRWLYSALRQLRGQRQQEIPGTASHVKHAAGTGLLRDHSADDREILPPVVRAPLIRNAIRVQIQIGGSRQDWMSEHGLAGIASPQTTAVDRALQDTTGKVVVVGNGTEASGTRATAQPARDRLRFHGRRKDFIES